MTDKVVEDINDKQSENQDVKSVAPQVEAITESSMHYLGYIDSFEGGVVRGWASNLNNLSNRIQVSIVSNNKIIGTGVADIYREDLDDFLEGGDGRYEYMIEVNTECSLGAEELSLTMIDAANGLLINPEPMTFKVHNSIFVQSMRVESGQIVTKLVSNAPLYEKKVNLFIEDTVINQTSINTEAHEVEIYQPFPIEYQDGKERLFKINISGITTASGMAYLKCHAIQTPWQYIKESFNKPGFLSKSEQADSRYESLSYQLDDIVSGNSLLTLEDIKTVHKVIVEGYQWRTEFPAFDLPKFEKPEVSIIVPAYNQFELTYHCIASIALAYNKTSYEVILADDCSTDETAKAEKVIGNLVVSRNEENLRFLRSCNQASGIAKGDFIIFLNNDTEVTSFWLDELISYMHQDTTVGMTGSKLLNLDGTLQEAGGIVWGNGEPWNVGRNVNPLTPEYNYAREVDYLTGAAMCIRSELWEQVGQFSQELVPCYYEDTDLAFKVRDAGYKTIYVPHSVVIHFEGQSHGTDVTKGLKRYQVINQATFRQKWFKAFRQNGTPSHENLRFEKDRNIEQRVLVIDYASPMPNKDAGSYAAIQEMKLIQSLGFKVTFVPANLAHFGKYTTELQKSGIEVLYAPFYHSINHVLETRLDEFDAVYITRYDIAKGCIDYIRDNSTAKIIFNNADLHFLREMRGALQNGRDQEKLEKALITREEELRVCSKADAVLCYNSTEHAVITSHILEADKLHITPWVLEEKPQGPVFEKRQGIAFLGGFNHAPNGEAVEYLASDIMPLLEKQRPDICLYVYGSNMPKAYKKYETDNIKMVGFAETLDGVYHDHRVFVAPLLSGAGIKGKVLESMAYNLPTVLTDVAAEGTGLTHGISTLIALEPQEWVDAIIKLYDDQTLWTKFAENSQTLVEAKYSPEHGRKVFKEIFASVGVYSSK